MSENTCKSCATVSANGKTGRNTACGHINGIWIGSFTLPDGNSIQCELDCVDIKPESEYPEELWQPPTEEIDLNSYCVDEVVVQYNYGTNPHPVCQPKTRELQGTCNDCYWDGSDYYVCGNWRYLGWGA